MIPKQADWNRVVPVGNGVCHDCHGKGEMPQLRGTYPCTSCKTTGVCHMCDGNGVRFDHNNCEFCQSNYETAEDNFYQAVGSKTTIDELLHEISENEMAQRVWKKCDAARESFVLDQNTVASWAEFESVISRFWAHYASRANFHDYMVPENPFLTAERFLKEIYGDTRIPYECARSGESGGLRAICNALHQKGKAQMSERVLKNTFDYFQMPERERLLREYLDKYGHLGKYKGQTALMLLFQFCDVMRSHVCEVEPSLRAAAERV